MNRREFLKDFGLALGGAACLRAVRAQASMGAPRPGAGLDAGALRAACAPQVAPAGDNPAVRANTFSICAVDAGTGEAGVAVASKCLSVGAHVCYAEPGVGAIASQAAICPWYGADGLALLRRGVAAAEVVRRLTDRDVTVTPDEEQYTKQYGQEGLKEEGVDFFRDRQGRRLVWLTSRMRQIAVVDRAGNAAAYNGARTFPWSGSIAGPGFSCQGNLLVGETVVKEMALSLIHI
mgnify:CR=1 FL=1